MDDGLDKPRVQADNNSIAIGEINISGIVTGDIRIGHTIVQAADVRLRHDLSILLKNVETTWIQGVLEKSVHQAALLELGMELREEAVDNPWKMVMERPDQSREILPQERKIKDIFDEANRLVLILGEPGSGKTTTLLQLARDLIGEIDSAFTQPIPVILNLSTWTNKQQPLDEWLIGELNSKYRLPKKDGKKWLRDHRILPLLDGLDEVKAENRAACVEKINQLVSDYGLQGLVACSRIKDYTDLNVRLAFYRAIYIQPLTSEQVDEYLNLAGDKLASLRAALQNDKALRSMAQSPLILNVMSLAYQNTSAEDLSASSLNTDKARHKHLFDTYIARMFNRKVSTRPYEDEKTKQHLSWLARNMQRHNQDVFLIESLQPSWMRIPLWQWVYTLMSRLIGGLILGPLVGLFFGDAKHNLVVLLLLGLGIGLSVGFLDLLRFVWLRKQKKVRTLSELWWSSINILTVSVLVGSIIRLIDWLLRVVNYLLAKSAGVNIAYSDMYFLWDILSLGTILGLILVGGLIFGLSERLKSHVLANLRTINRIIAM
jgi:DNA polymerase III delta prime subunit